MRTAEHRLHRPAGDVCTPLPPPDAGSRLDCRRSPAMLSRSPRRRNPAPHLSVARRDALSAQRPTAGCSAAHVWTPPTQRVPGGYLLSPPASSSSSSSLSLVAVVPVSRRCRWESELIASTGRHAKRQTLVASSRRIHLLFASSHFSALLLPTLSSGRRSRTACHVPPEKAINRLINYVNSVITVGGGRGGLPRRVRWRSRAARWPLRAQSRCSTLQAGVAEVSGGSPKRESDAKHVSRRDDDSRLIVPLDSKC